MAINNNVQNVKFLRNGSLFESREAAKTAMNQQLSGLADGVAILGRYSGETASDVKTLVGFAYVSGDTKTLTFFDVDGAAADVEALRTEINNKLGEGVTSANTATAQFAALSGSNADTSATTSVAGAKKYAEALISELDYSGVTTGEGVYVTNVTEADGVVAATTAVLPTVETITAEGKPIIAVAEDKGTISASAGTIDSQYVTVTGFTSQNVQAVLEEINNGYKSAISGLDFTDEAVAGQYVSKVDEVDGVISVTRVELPSSADTAVAKKFVTAVAEDKGQITVSRGEITSSGKTIVLSDGADGGIDFAVNIDNNTLTKNENGVISVTSSALVQYEGDDDTIQIGAVSSGVRTVSSPLTIQKVTEGLSAEVKEEYHLVGHSGNTIGDPVKIYKDSHIVSITYITDSGDTHYQNLEYKYIDASGNTQTTYVDMSMLVLEAEFASGLTIENHVARGVVDPTSETFLTVGEDGFKLSGVQSAIDTAVGTAVSGLDATVSASTSHISVQIDEVDGKLTAVTLTEDDIASADDIAGLSAKTITKVESSNSSISAATAATTDGTVKVDVTTDASKIKMTGFTADASGFTAITTASTVTEAVKAIETEYLANEKTTAAALTDLDSRLDVIEPIYLSGVSVNGSATTITDKVAGFTIESATGATTATGNEAITVATDANGNITLGLATIDAGLY